MIVSTGMSMATPVFRFAPSPNGYLHLGHALSALTNEAFAKALGGQVLLRIEDIDPDRSRSAFEVAIREDLDWLGVRFEPEIRRQSLHLDVYARALGQLRDLSVIYACRCSRAAVRDAVARRPAPWPIDPDGAPRYPQTCRGLGIEDGEVYALRLDMERAIALAGEGLSFQRFDAQGRIETVSSLPARWGDVVLARKGIPTSYHLSVVVDDALQGVTHVVRGEDLAAATDIHVLLQRLLHLPTPLYHFHRLVLDADQQKLAKSRGSVSLRDLRAGGATAAGIRAQLGFQS